jgi:hypothetical protein
MAAWGWGNGCIVAPQPPCASATERGGAGEGGDGLAGEIGGGADRRAVAAGVDEAVDGGVGDGKIHAGDAVGVACDVGEGVEATGLEFFEELGPVFGDDFDFAKAGAAHRGDEFGGEAGGTALVVEKRDGVIGDLHTDAQTRFCGSESGHAKNEQKAEIERAHERGVSSPVKNKTGASVTPQTRDMSHTPGRPVEPIASGEPPV